MPNQWCRLYHKFASDPDVQMMPEHMQRRLAMLFIMRSSETLHGTLHETEVSFFMRISIEETLETKRLFMSKKWIDSGWQLLSWEKLQNYSDSSTARVKAFRARKAAKLREPARGAVSPAVSPGVSETPRTEQNRSKDLYIERLNETVSETLHETPKSVEELTIDEQRAARPTASTYLDKWRKEGKLKTR
jgi:hypothetical protein